MGSNVTYHMSQLPLAHVAVRVFVAYGVTLSKGVRHGPFVYRKFCVRSRPADGDG